MSRSYGPSFAQTGNHRSIFSQGVRPAGKWCACASSSWMGMSSLEEVSDHPLTGCWATARSFWRASLLWLNVGGKNKGL